MPYTHNSCLSPWGDTQYGRPGTLTNLGGHSMRPGALELWDTGDRMPGPAPGPWCQGGTMRSVGSDVVR